MTYVIVFKHVITSNMKGLRYYSRNLFNHFLTSL